MAGIANGKSELYWVAIDVARNWSAVLIETADGQRHRFKMANTAVDFARLIAFIKGLGGRWLSLRSKRACSSRACALTIFLR